jgi:hypothetical protein
VSEREIIKILENLQRYFKKKRQERKWHELKSRLETIDTLAEEKKWLLYFKRIVFERRLQRIMASMPPHDELGREKQWRNTRIPPHWITPEILAGLEKASQHCVKIIQPSILLINICGNWASSDSKPAKDYAGSNSV